MEITLQINGRIIPKGTYKVIEFLNGNELKIVAVYNDQKEFIEKNPEQFKHDEHDHLFSEEEKLNLSQSMRGQYGI